MKFVVKLFPEIIIKSRPVRQRFIKRLQSNMRIILKRIDNDIKVSAHWDRLVVKYYPEMSDDLKQEVIDAIGKISGIAHFQEVVEYPLVSFQDVFERTLPVYEDRLAGKTFRVRVKRAGIHEFTSVDLEKYVGGGLRQHTQATAVKLNDPDVCVDIEVKDDKFYIVEKFYPGLGGYPLGSQEAVLSLISGGFDSVVSSHMTMRRGSKTHFLFFNLGGKAHEIGVKQVAQHLWRQYGSSARVKFISVPFSEVIGDILQHVHHSHMGVVLKRQMMRAAEKVADEFGIDTLVTGESIAQVSSQTLPNLRLIDNVTDKLILRPLITTDKQQIVNKTKELGCFDVVKMIPEYCGVISDRPTTKARQSRIEKEELNLDMAILDQAVEQSEILMIDKVEDNLDIESQIESLSKISDNQVIVDIRTPYEQERKPLNMPGCDILQIPFYDLEGKIEGWDAHKEYLLFCDQGLKSQLHAQHLRDKGYENIKVYRPKV